MEDMYGGGGQVEAEKPTLAYYVSYDVLLEAGQPATPGWQVYETEQPIITEEDIGDMIFHLQTVVAHKLGRLPIVVPRSWQLLI